MSDNLETVRKEVEILVSKLKSTIAATEDYKTNLNSVGKLNSSVTILLENATELIQKLNNLSDSIWESLSGDMLTELKAVRTSLTGLDELIKTAVANQSDTDKAYHKSLAQAIIKKNSESISATNWNSKMISYIAAWSGVLNVLLILLVLIIK